VHPSEATSAPAHLAHEFADGIGGSLDVGALEPLAEALAPALADALAEPLARAHAHLVEDTLAQAVVHPRAELLEWAVVGARRVHFVCDARTIGAPWSRTAAPGFRPATT
jgi:hypothetical protein